MKGKVLVVLIILIGMISGIVPIHAIPRSSPYFPTNGTCQAAPDGGGPSASGDYSVQHKLFYQQGRWWLFYVNNTASPHEGINYVSFTDTSDSTPTGLVPCSNRVEGHVPGTNYNFGSGGVYAVDSNSTEVFLLVTCPCSSNIDFTFGMLNPNGVITNWAAITHPSNPDCVGSSCYDGEIRYQASTGKLYIFWNEYGLTPNNHSNEWFSVSNDRTYQTWPNKQAVLTGTSQDDIVMATADLGNGTIYGVYSQFWQRNSTGLQDFFTRGFTGAVMGPQGTIPRPFTLGALQPSFFYIWSPSKAVVSGDFSWATATNSTLINDIWYSTTLSPTGAWATPSRPNPDPVVATYNTKLNIATYTACQTYDPSSNLLGIQIAGGSSPWQFYANLIMQPRSQLNYFMNLTNFVPLITNWQGGQAGTGFCPQYTLSDHSYVWGYENGTNISNKCNNVLGGGIPCQIIVGTTSLPQPTFTTEQQATIFQDSFLYQNNLMTSYWTVDRYTTINTPSGIYDSSGFLYLKAQTTDAISSVHSTNPIFSPISQTDGTVIKRKMTVALNPFLQGSTVNHADIRVGMFPLNVTGAYPGSNPYGTPINDYNCVQKTAEFGDAYMTINNAGLVTYTFCGDGGLIKQNLETVSNVALFSVVTVETRAIFCATCLDNQLAGSGWVYFRFYQESPNGLIISKTDRNVNSTTLGNGSSQVTPFVNSLFASVILTTNDAGASKEVSRVNFIQVQNWGSGLLITPPAPIAFPTPQTAGGLVLPILQLATFVGFGNPQTGIWIIYFIFMIGTVFPIAFLSKSTIASVSAFVLLTTAFVYAGFLPTFLIFIILLGIASVAFMVFIRVIQGSGGRSMESTS